MKKILIFIAALGITSPVGASAPDCTIAALNTEFIYASLPIQFSDAFIFAVQDRGYQAVRKQSPHRYEFDFVAESRPTRYFGGAYVHFWIKDLVTGKMHFEVKNTKRCFTWGCSITDFRNSIAKNLRKMRKQLPRCETQF